ncbi:MAG: DUF2974 domain-containing protein [Lachnospiraceae bacterium]|nr:DUF2974 domain-containing protein [Lachnospiraceae bacterium]
MLNITAYVKKYGNRTLNELPFGEVDSLILCQLSYLKFDDILHIDDMVKLGVLSGHKNIASIYLDKRYSKNNRELFEACASSERYKDIILKNYVNITDRDKEIQFSALTFIFDDTLSYIAFRGTDDTITGWREDFNMAYKSPIPAQIHALSYLENIIDLIPGSIYVGGHSKGGNLAVYSVAKCSYSHKQRIKKVYSHDGPGFRSGIITDYEAAYLKKHLEKSVPSSSVIGMLLEESGSFEIVDCRGFSFMQHNPFNWAIRGHRFKKDKSITRSAYVGEESINKWVMDMSEEELKTFVETLFELFDIAGISNVNTFYDNTTESIIKIIKAAGSIDEDRRQLMNQFFKRLVYQTRPSAQDMNELKLFDNTDYMKDGKARLKKEFKNGVRLLKDYFNRYKPKDQ